MSTHEPNPYAPTAEDPAPPRATRPDEATSAQRLAGGFLIANAALGLMWVATSAGTPAAQGTAVTPGVGIVSAVIDLMIGTSLVRGQRKLVAFATVRVGLGLVLFTAMQIGNPFAAVMQAVICGGLLLLLVGDAGKPRMIAGASMTGLYILVTVAGLLGDAIGHNAIRATALKASGELEADPVHRVTGVAYPYTLDLPGGKWYLRAAAATKRDQPAADRWLVRPDKDAHVIVIAEHVPGKTLELDAYTDACVDAARKTAAEFKLVDRLPLRSDPEGGRLLHNTFTVQGLQLERVMATVVAGERGFQVIAWAEHKRFPELAAELREIVESFRLPADAAQVSASSELEPSPVNRVTGVSYPYEIETPGRRWYVRKAEVAQKDQPLADRWLVRPDKGAHVVVIAEHEPGANVLIDKFADQVIANAKTRGNSFELLGREPLGSDPARGRFVRASATVDGALRLEYAYGLIAAGDRAFQVIGFAEKKSYPLVEAELKRVIESFRLPR